MAGQQPAHHELPRYYLRGFCEPSTSFLWRFERDSAYIPGPKHGNNPRRLGLRKVGVHPHGYSATPVGHVRHVDFEGALQKMEHMADDAIRRARQFKQLSTSDKDVLARYIALMWRRVSSQEGQLRAAVEKHFDLHALESGARAFARVGKFHDARRLLEEVAWYRSGRGKRQLLLEAIVSSFDNFHAGLMRLKWQLYRAVGESQCVTCDVPVAYNREIGVRRSPLYFPLSSHVIVVATWDGDEDLVWHNATPSEIDEFNAAVILCSNRYVYASSPDERIQRVFQTLATQRKVAPNHTSEVIQKNK